MKTKDQNLQDRISVLEKVIISVSEIHSGTVNENHKAFLETIIGAALFYVSNSKELYSGFISKSGWDYLMAGGIKLSKEHGYPRKIGSRRLLETQCQSFHLTGQSLMELYTQEYGRYNLVLPAENHALRKYQKATRFTDMATAYNLANIELIEKSLEEIYAVIKANKKNQEK